MAMKRALLLILLVFLSYVQVSAQRKADIGWSSGLVNYMGDLGNEKYFPFSTANIGSAFTIRNFLNNPKNSGTYYRAFDLQLRFSWHRLQYDETAPLHGKKGTEL